jgi:hypothetical protein
MKTSPSIERYLNFQAEVEAAAAKPLYLPGLLPSLDTPPELILRESDEASPRPRQMLLGADSLCVLQPAAEFEEGSASLSDPASPGFTQQVHNQGHQTTPTTPGSPLQTETASQIESRDSVPVTLDERTRKKRLAAAASNVIRKQAVNYAKRYFFGDIQWGKLIPRPQNTGLSRSDVNRKNTAHMRRRGTLGIDAAIKIIKANPAWLGIYNKSRERIKSEYAREVHEISGNKLLIAVTDQLLKEGLIRESIDSNLPAERVNPSAGEMASASSINSAELQPKPD